MQNPAASPGTARSSTPTCTTCIEEFASRLPGARIHITAAHGSIGAMLCHEAAGVLAYIGDMPHARCWVTIDARGQEKLWLGPNALDLQDGEAPKVVAALGLELVNAATPL